MNCEEFREKIKSGSDYSESLIEHKNSCKDCQEWIMNELNTAPNGINKEEWQKLMAKHLPIVEKQEKQKKEIKSSESETLPNKEKEQKTDESKEPQKEKSMLDYYFSGLKYGIVFGLSLVVGFSIVQNSQNTQNNEQNSTNIRRIASDTANIASDSIKTFDVNASESVNIK